MKRNVPAEQVADSLGTTRASILGAQANQKCVSGIFHLRCSMFTGASVTWGGGHISAAAEDDDESILLNCG